MSDAYIIEIADEAAGIVVREDRETSFRFHASLPRFFSLDGARFASAREAERAVLKHARTKHLERGRAA